MTDNTKKVTRPQPTPKATQEAIERNKKRKEQERLPRNQKDTAGN